MPPKPNLRSTAIKRILQEHKEFTLDPSDDFAAHPLEDDLFDWHVTLKGAPGGDYDGGIYHLRVLLPPTYPLTPPDIQILTPSGRFETQKNICIDGITSFHTGSWRPIWGIRTAVVGLGGFWGEDGKDAVGGYGGLSCSKEERRRLAAISSSYTCPTCQRNNKEIMQTHEETVKEARKAKADKVAAATSGSSSDSDLAVVEAGSNSVAKGEEADDLQRKVPGDDEEHTIPGSTGNSKGKGRESEVEQRKDEITVEEKQDTATNTTTTRQPHSSILLYPILSHPYLPAPIKLYIHLVRLLLIPASTFRAQGFPDRLDTILLMDTLIWVVGILVVVVVGGKVGRKLGWGLNSAGSAGGATVAAGARAGGPGAVAAAAAGQANIRRPRHLNPDQAAQNTHVHLRRYGGAPARAQQQQGGGGQPQQHVPGGVVAGGEPGAANPTQEPGLAGPPTTTTTTTGNVETRGEAGLDDPAAVRRARAIAEERTQGI